MTGRRTSWRFTDGATPARGHKGTSMKGHDDLIRKMLDAFYLAGVASASTFPYSPEQIAGMERVLILMRQRNENS